MTGWSKGHTFRPPRHLTVNPAGDETDQLRCVEIAAIDTHHKATKERKTTLTQVRRLGIKGLPARFLSPARQGASEPVNETPIG